jgi:mono/diheme cytochrome c family protein
MRLVGLGFLISMLFVAPGARAADADNGKRIVEARCVSCHSVATRQRREVADAPPLEAIAAKFGFNADVLAYSLLDPHPRMNEALTRREAQDVAAYISTLAR